MPRNPEVWKEVAKGFSQRWNYPLCLGSLDGKHVRIARPPNSGSLYYNYKGFYSIILFALVTGSYDVLYCDVGMEGRISDSGIWSVCALQEHLTRGSLHIPPPGLLPNTDIRLPYHFIGDDAFPLGEHLMKPYGHRNLDERELIFNYRICRARRVVENVFGLIATRFRIFHTEIAMRPPSVTTIVKAVVILHNILNKRSGATYIPPGTVDHEDGNFTLVPGEWRRKETLANIRTSRARNARDVAKNQRDVLCDYFNNARGSVPWQNEQVRLQYGQ